MIIGKQTLQKSATTGNGDAIQLEGQPAELVIYVIGEGSVSAGQIQVETADEADYAGTWAPFSDPVDVPADGQLIVQITGAFYAVRTRISTDIVDGTVTTKLVANGG